MSLTSSTAHYLRKAMADYGNVKETAHMLDIRQGAYRLTVSFTRGGGVLSATMFVDEIGIFDVHGGRNKLARVEDLLEKFAVRVAQSLPADEIMGKRVQAVKASMAADREAEAERAKAGAEALAKATGSVSATFVVEHRHLDGTLERVAEETWVAPRSGVLPDHVVEGIANGTYSVVTELDPDVKAAPLPKIPKAKEVCAQCAMEIRRKESPQEKVHGFGVEPIRDRCELCDGTFERPWPAGRMAFRVWFDEANM